MKKTLAAALILTVLAGGYLSMVSVDSEAVPAAGVGQTYKAEIFVAGMGGHFAQADVTIDPTSETPITLNKPLGMMRIGTSESHPTHDIRIDVNDRNIGFWSTYRPGKDGNLRVGKSDLRTGKVLLDVAVPPDSRITWAGANYCASGQSRDYFMPVFMGQPGFIDVFSKTNLTHKHRVFFGDALGFKPGEYTFAHGTNTPDMKHFLLTLNLSPEGHTQFSGNTRLIMLEMEALEQGRVKKVAEATIHGKPRDGAVMGTISFRQRFTPDGSLLFQSAADRGYIIDAKTLKVLQVVTPLPGEAHDMMPTPDGNFAIFTLRQRIFSAPDEGMVTDGVLALYDVRARAIVGKTTSVCLACHNQFGKYGSAVLCGLDANFKKWQSSAR